MGIKAQGPQFERSRGRTAKWSVTRIVWIVLAILCAAMFFAAAMSWEVYRDTSPPHLAMRAFGSDASDFAHPWWLSLHVLVRKAYSIGAFAIVGFTAEKALAPTMRPALRMTLLVAVYSAAIEVGQYWRGSHEGLIWNVIDIACGAIGGWLAIALERNLARRVRS